MNSKIDTKINSLKGAMNSKIGSLESKIDAITTIMNEMHAIVSATKEPKRRAH